MQRLLAPLALAVLCASAGAAQFDFYKLGNGGVDFLPSDGIACTGGDLCSSNVDGSVFNGDLNFTIGALTATATGAYSGGFAAVVQDHETGWTASKGAGLGVYHKKDNSDDNITVGETLTITFSTPVKITGMELRSEGHNYTGWTSGATFLLGGTSTALPAGTGHLATSLTGTTFTFAYGGTKPDQFYLAALTAVPVPEPQTISLLLAGLAAIGFVARRRARD